MTFYHDVPSNTLIYPRHALITQTIPEAREINGQFVAVPRSLHNCQVLRHYNFPVAPIITDETYNWPRPPNVKQPYESQKTTANFLVLHPRSFCLSDMGCGKTMAILWAIDWLMRRSTEDFKALIVCPVSIMKRVWGDAIFKTFLGKRKFVVLYGSAAKRLELLKTPADFYICNFEGLGVGAHMRKKQGQKPIELDGFSKALAERKDIKIAVVDEASAYKDSQTKRHHIARLVIGTRPYLWLISGTPTPNDPTDAYGLSKLVNGAFGKSYTTFRLETMYKATQFKWVPQRDGYEKARKLLTPSIRYDIKDVWDGPLLTTQQREIELTAEQKKNMADLKRDLVVAVKSGVHIDAINEAAARTKFIQISLGAIYDGKHKVHLIDASPRINELKDLIEQVSGKILIFVPLTSVVNMLYKELGPKRDAQGRITQTGWTREIVDGNTSEADRARIFQAFQQEPEPRILVAHPGTMAHGLDLWMAQTVVWYGPCDVPEVYTQGNARAHRPGQKFPVTVVQFVSNKLEREIFSRLDMKRSLEGSLLDMVREDSL